MKTRAIVPLVGEINTHSHASWLRHLQVSMPNFRIVPFEQQSDYSQTEVALVANPNPADLANMPKLKWVQSLWAGVEKLVPELPPDIAIVRMTDPQLARTMAEAVLTMTLFIHRGLPLYASQQHAGVWQQHSVLLPEDVKVGILGLGNLGQAAGATLSLQGFDVLGWSRSHKNIPNIQCLSGKQGLYTLLRASDIVVVLLPLTNETHGLLNEESLSYLKLGASLINFARAPILDTAALVNQLQTGHIAHAVLDVFDTEPLPASHILWRTKNLTILPHISAPTNMKTAAQIAAHNLKVYFETGRIPPRVNRAAGY